MQRLEGWGNRSHALIRLAAILAVLATTAAGCADSGDIVQSPQGFNRVHSFFEDYGTSSGFTNPGSWWRGLSEANCI